MKSKFILMLLSPFIFIHSTLAEPEFSDQQLSFADLSFSFDSLSLETPSIPSQRGKKKNTLGTYSGTFVLAKSKSFNGASCTPTQSFPAVFTVSGKKNRPTGQLGNIPISFTGRANKKGAKLKGTYVSNGLTRKYTMLIRKVKSQSAKLIFKETIKSGSLKACLFKHTASFSRS